MTKKGFSKHPVCRHANFALQKCEVGSDYNFKVCINQNDCPEYKYSWVRTRESMARELGKEPIDYVPDHEIYYTPQDVTMTKMYAHCVFYRVCIDALKKCDVCMYGNQFSYFRKMDK